MSIYLYIFIMTLVSVFVMLIAINACLKSHDTLFEAIEKVKQIKASNTNLRPLKEVYDGPWESFSEKKDAAEDYAIQTARYPVKESEYLADLEDAFISGVEWKEKGDWKPSKEQMETLKFVIRNHIFGHQEHQGILESLRNDLKKL